MNSSQNPALVGRWTDYRTGERLLSVEHPGGIVIIALGGIWLSWSTRYVRKIAGNAILWMHIPRNSEPQRPASSEYATESTSLLGHAPRNAISGDTQSLAKALKDKSGIRDLYAKIFFSKELTTRERAWLSGFAIMVQMFASVIIWAVYCTTKISVNGPAILYSDRCGLWLYDGDKRSEAATRARMIDLEKEERAAQFADDCYGHSGAAASRCKILYQPTLEVSNGLYTNDCPFHQDICRMNQTITFKTPTLDAGDLGINSRSTPKFRRSTSCSPLSMEYPYIQNKTENGTTTFTYHYGPKHGDGDPVDYTYLTVGNPWDRLAPIYDVFAYSSNADETDRPVWKPHPYLKPPEYSTVTIIFVSSLRIIYEEHSDDPIFPADKEYRLPGDHKAWFRNSDPRARPLACIDTIEVCTADGLSCWNINEPTTNTTVADDTPEYILLYSSLFKTDIYYSLAKRQGRSLLAQKKVSQYFSSSLGPDPWVTEVESWVRTALARTSINTWSVASGEDSVHAGKDGFTEVTRGYGELCGKYKYNPQGYQSLLFVPLLLVALGLPFIWFLSWDWRPIEKSFIKMGLPAPLNGTANLGQKIVLELRTSLGVFTEKLRSWLSISDNSRSQSRPGTANDSPVLTEGAAGQRRPSTSEAQISTATASGQNEGTQSSNIRGPDSEASMNQDSETAEEDRVVWEPLVLHQAIYIMGLVALAGVWLFIWVLTSLWAIARNGINRLVPNNDAVTANT